METNEMSLNYLKTENLSDNWKKCCRICHFERGRLLTLCKCKGSLAFVHEKCQLQWLQVKDSTECEICSSELNVEKVNEDFSDWIRLRDNKFRIYLYVDIICGLIVFPVFLWTVYLVSLSSSNTESKATVSMLWASLVTQFLMVALWVCVCFSHH